MSPDKSPRHLPEQHPGQKINLPLPPLESFNEFNSYIGQMGPDLNLRTANESFIRELSQIPPLNPEQPLHLSNFIPQENLDKFRQVLNTLTPQKSETSFDMQLGDTFLGWRVNAIFDPDNKINHYTFIGREITEKIREQQKLEQNALIDPLTGLYNRRYLYEQLDNFGNSGEIKGVTIVMFDADNFKNINDSLGHDKGDEILCQVANILKKNTHSTDIIGRWGGDEFLGIFPNLTDPDDVQKLLFHLNNSLLENNLHVSFGFSIANRNGSINPLDLKLNVALADKSLYEIKPNKNLLK